MDEKDKPSHKILGREPVVWMFLAGALIDTIQEFFFTLTSTQEVILMALIWAILTFLTRQSVTPWPGEK